MRKILCAIGMMLAMSACTDKVPQCIRRCEARLGSYANAVCADLCGNSSDPGAMFQFGH